MGQSHFHMQLFIYILAVARNEEAKRNCSLGLTASLNTEYGISAGAWRGHFSTSQRALKRPWGLAHGGLALGTEWAISHWCDGGFAGPSCFTVLLKGVPRN